MHIPLKITTDYTLLKSLIKVPTLISFFREHNITACGICDENLYGVLDFYNSAIKNNIKPLIGLSIKLNGFPIYLYAMDYSGYKNLLKLNTIKEQKEISVVDLEKYKNNILAIMPFTSKDIYESVKLFKHLYIGYKNEYEKKSALLISDNIVFIKDIRALNLDDVKYLEFLDDLRKEEHIDYSDNYYKDELVSNDKTEEIINLLNVSIPKGNRYIPNYNKDIDSSLFLKNLAFKGIHRRLNGIVDEKYTKRLNHELEVINNMGFVDYFLIVYDYVLYAKKNNILVGPGRGSAAGSLVSYAIGITDIDPLKYDLLFERFLNPARVTMPDIDIDFDATKREEVISYVRNRYGEKNVALGLTFNTLKSKLVLREVGKILNINSDLIDKFVRVIDGNLNLKDNLNIPSVKSYLNNYKELRELYNISYHLEGLKKNVSTHAAGVVISSIELDEVIPIHYENDILITGVTMDFLEDIGLLKMDFLGLKNLTTIANIIRNIGSNVLKDIDLEDKDVYNLFKSGKTEGVFQFETPMMKNLSVKLKPNSFSDLVAGVALGRPGPKEHALDFIKRKEGLEPVTYIDQSLESILKETYGILIYQEQIIAILGKVGGYSYQEADLIRRAISKKKENILKAEEEKFIKRAIDNGYKEEKAKEIYDLIVKFANYGFNKSHSVAYAKVAYQMAYLKAHYPIHFFVELLNSKDNVKNSTYFSYLKSKGVIFHKPSINNIINDYFITKNDLYMPLWLIKGISVELSSKILKQKGENYSDFFDFCYKTKDFINEKILISLINADAFLEFNLNHQTLINNIDKALNYASLADDSGLIEKPIMIMYPEYEDEKLRADEIDSFGFYITNHPASKYLSDSYMKLINLEKNVFKKIKCVVLIDKITKIKTKKNEDMAFFTASDETAGAEFTVFPANYPLVENLNNNSLVEVSGEIRKRFDKYSIIVNNIRKVG